MDISYTLFISLSTLLSLLPDFWLIIPAFEKRLKFSFLMSNALALVVSLLTLSVVFLLPPPYIACGSWQFFFSAFYLLTLAAFFLSTIKGPPSQVLFALFVAEGYTNDVILLSGLCKPVWQMSGLPHVGFLLTQMMILAATLPMIRIVFIRVLPSIIESSGHLPFWRYLWVLPASFYMLFHLGVQSTHWEPSCGANQAVLLLHCVWTIVTVLSVCVIMRMLSAIANNSRFDEDPHISTLQTAIRERYERLQHDIEETHRARHDLRHHLLAIQGYAKLEDFKAIEHYLGDYFDALRLEDDDVICDNDAASAIVRHYVRAARKENISLRLFLRIPRQLAAAEGDLRVLLGILFERAIAACSLQDACKRFICVKVNVQQEHIILNVKHSLAREASREGDFRLPSQRPDDEIAFAAIRRIAEKYHGYSNFSHRNGVFEASILLNTNESTARRR